MDEILVDAGSFRESKATMEESLTVFGSYSKDYLEDVIGQLDPFNSDFVEGIMWTIDNMKDTKAPKLVEALQGYADQLSVIAEGFTGVDEEIRDRLN